MAGRIDVFVNVHGSGKLSQAGAVMLGLARALKDYRPDLEAKLREHGMLTRDARHGRAQEVRPQKSPQELPVFQALSRTCGRRSHATRPIRIVALGTDADLLLSDRC